MAAIGWIKLAITRLQYILCKHTFSFSSHVPTSPTNRFAEYEQRTLARLLRLINCRLIITIIKTTFLEACEHVIFAAYFRLMRCDEFADTLNGVGRSLRRQTRFTAATVLA